MLSHEDNELLVRTGPGTPMGELQRRYWQPIAVTGELAENPVKAFMIRQTREKDIALFLKLSKEAVPAKTLVVYPCDETSLREAVREAVAGYGPATITFAP